MRDFMHATATLLLRQPSSSAPAWCLAAIVLALAPAAGCRRGDVEPAAFELTPIRSPPAEHAELRARLRSLETAGRYTEALRDYPRFLAALESSWGKDNADLAPYHYNHSLTLLLARKANESLSESERAVARWPRNVQCLLVNVKASLEVSRQRRSLVEGLRERAARLLSVENHDALKAMHVDPHDMRVETASVLYDIEGPAEALRELDTVLAAAPNHVRARRLRAEVLVTLRRSSEALPLLDEACAQDEAAGGLETRFRRLRALALLDTGRAEEAWAEVEKLRAGPQRDDSRVPDEPLGVLAARCLNELRRFSAARDLLLDELARIPDDKEALHHLAVSLDGLGLAAPARAVRSRSQEITAAVNENRLAREARKQNRAATAAYHEARAAIDARQLGTALGVLSAGLAEAPGERAIQLLILQLAVELGRLPRILKELDVDGRRLNPQLAAFARARWLARTGQAAAARETALSVGPGLPAALVAWERARSLLEAADLAGALEAVAIAERSASIETVPTAGPLRDHCREAAALCRCEAMSLGGDERGAAKLLSQSFRALPGGDVWADALRLALTEPAGDDPSRRAAEESVDPSPLFDHPRLVAAGSPFRERILARGGLEPFAAGADRLIARRAQLLVRMAEFSDADVETLWHELLELYVGCAAWRKAQEAAWYLWWRRPTGGVEALWVARSLSRREETLVRLAAIGRRSARDGDDGEIHRLRREGLAFLGLTP